MSDAVAPTESTGYASGVIAAVVPAAGSSRRMGEPKLLLPFGPATTVLGAYLGALRTGGVDRSVVVVAPGDRDLAREAGRWEATAVVNPRPERGMLSSLWTGLETLTADGPAALVLGPADFPALSAETVRRLLRAIAAGAPLAVPVVDGVRGHPLAVTGDLAGEIRRLDPAIGLRQLLERLATEVEEVAVTDPGALLDVDDEGSYREAATLARDGTSDPV